MMNAPKPMQLMTLAPTERQLLKKQPIPEFREWLEKRGFWENGHLGKNAGDPSMFFDMR